MSDPQVDQWRQQGMVAMWIAKGAWKAQWNISADDAACDSLVELLNRFAAATWPSFRKVQLVALSLTPCGTSDGVYPLRFAKKLKISYPKDRVPNDHWSLSYQEGEVSLEIGHSRLDLLREAVCDIKRGGGDYAIGPDEARLWIRWWLPTVRA